MIGIVCYQKLVAFNIIVENRLHKICFKGFTLQYNQKSSEKEELLSKVIDFLRFPLMIGVVIIHCRFTSILQPQLLVHVQTGGIYYYVSWLFSKVIFGICVPVFFFISGFLFFREGKFTFQTYISKLKRRFFSVFVPFFCWNVIYILIFIVLGYNIICLENGDPKGFVPWINGNTGNVLKRTYCWVMGVFINFNGSGSPADVPLWYIRELICMFILSPVIYWFVKHLKHYSLIIAALVWVISGMYVTLPYIFMRPAILFFLMGAYFALNKIDFVELFSKIKGWIYIAYGVIAILDLFSNELICNFYIHRITVLIGIIVSFKIATLMVKKKEYPESDMLKRIKNTNFFLFAFHWILLYWLAFPLSKIYNGSDASLIVIYFIEMVLCCAIAIVLGMLLNKLFPRTMRFLDGR